jgi:hypothetical protein
LTPAQTVTPPYVDLSGGNGGPNYSTWTYGGSTYSAHICPNAIVSYSGELTSATMTLTNRPDGSSEYIAIQDFSLSGLSTSGYNPGTGQLTVSGSMDSTVCQALLRSIIYVDLKTIPNTSDRKITLRVGAGLASSNLPAVTLGVAPAPASTGVLELGNPGVTTPGTGIGKPAPPITGGAPSAPQKMGGSGGGRRDPDLMNLPAPGTVVEIPLSWFLNPKPSTVQWPAKIDPTDLTSTDQQGRTYIVKLYMPPGTVALPSWFLDMLSKCGFSQRTGWIIRTLDLNGAYRVGTYTAGCRNPNGNGFPAVVQTDVNGGHTVQIPAHNDFEGGCRFGITFTHGVGKLTNGWVQIVVSTWESPRTSRYLTLDDGSKAFLDNAGSSTDPRYPVTGVYANSWCLVDEPRFPFGGLRQLQLESIKRLYYTFACYVDFENRIIIVDKTGAGPWGYTLSTAPWATPR